MPDSPNDLTVVTPYPGKSPCPYLDNEAIAFMKQVSGLRSYHLVTNDGGIVATLDVWYGPSRHVFIALWDAENRALDKVSISFEQMQRDEKVGLREHCEGVLEKKMTEMLEHNGLRFITSLV